MKKNVAGQSIGAQLVNATTGAAFTGSVTVAITGDNGTQTTGSVGAGACTHEGNGYHSYAPAQAETNYDHIAFTFTGTGAVPVTVQVFTTYPQTGDIFPLVGTPSNLGSGATLAGNLVDIESQTDDIGVAGAGLTALPWAAAWDAEVQSEVQDALEVNNLDHLVKLAADVSFANTVHLDSVIGQLADNGTTATFARATHSLEALRDHATTIKTETASIQADTDAIEADTQDIQARLPAALVSGRMASDAVAISGSTSAAESLETNIANLDAQVSTRATPAQVSTQVAAVLDTAVPTTPTADSLNERLKTLDDNYTAARAPALDTITTNLNATVSSRASQASLDTVDDLLDTEIPAIKAKTDQLTFTATNLHSHTKAEDNLPLTAQQKLDVNTEADSALSDAGVTTTVTGRLDAAVSTRATPAQVNAEVLDVLDVDTYTEPGQGAPPATTTLATRLRYLYKWFRNTSRNNGTVTEYLNDASSVVDHKRATSEAAGLVTQGPMVSGP